MVSFIDTYLSWIAVMCIFLSLNLRCIIMVVTESAANDIFDRVRIESCLKCNSISCWDKCYIRNLFILFRVSLFLLMAKNTVGVSKKNPGLFFKDLYERTSFKLWLAGTKIYNAFRLILFHAHNLQKTSFYYSLRILKDLFWKTWLFAFDKYLHNYT